MDNNTNNKEVAVKLCGVKKMYKLGQIGGGTLQADLQSWWARVRGKEDPNTKIDADQRLIGKTFMALNGIDLTIYRGEALGIIGSNGAGKSTMLKLLSRVTAPTEGTIDIYGRIASMLEVGTGFNPEMTGRENVYMNGAILGMTKAEIDAKMEDIIGFSEVREFIDTPVKRYSSGMFVKLAFSVAAHLDSEIMIMDEVLAVGDMAFQKKCLTKMREAANKEGRTVLYVSHNMSTIRQLCSRCIVLDKGKIVFDGDVESAIGTYMKSVADIMCTDIDLSKKRMAHLPKKVRAKITHVTLLDKDVAVYRMYEKMPLLIRIEGKDNIESISLRIEVRSIDDIMAGTALVQCFDSLVANQSVDYHLVADFEGLVPGKYIVCLVLYETGSSGSIADLDAIFPGFAFEVRDVDDSLEINWTLNSWGKVKFKDITLTKIERH